MPNAEQPLTDRIYKFLQEAPLQSSAAVAERLQKPKNLVRKGMSLLASRGALLKVKPAVGPSLWCVNPDSPEYSAKERQRRKRKPAIPEPPLTIEQQAQALVNGWPVDLACAVYKELHNHFRLESS